MKVFFTGDTHFGHTNIAGPDVSNWSSGFRNFKTTSEMDETLIRNWNTLVGQEDVVYHVGDFAFCGPDKALPILKRLNGKIHLILGNHDKTAKQLSNHFASVSSYQEIIIEKQAIVLFHYPIESWNGMHRGSWMIHGHCHFHLPVSEGRKIDTGVDNPMANYAPISFEDMQRYMAKKGQLKVDHHGG